MKRETRSHIAFTKDEMRLLWKNINLPYVDLILIQCYSGWRPQEMGKLLLSDVDIRQGIFKGGMKTPAGKQRIVPIHSCIQALVKNRYDLAREAGSEYLFFASDGITHKECTQLTYDKYAGRFDRVMEELGIKNHRPHDPRKTFVTMAKMQIRLSMTLL